MEIHEEVFEFVLKIAEEKKLLKGKTVGVDSTTLEANAAMKSFDRKDTGEDWQEYLTRLAKEADIENPTDEDLRRFDKNRTGRFGFEGHHLVSSFDYIVMSRYVNHFFSSTDWKLWSGVTSATKTSSLSAKAASEKII